MTTRGLPPIGSLDGHTPSFSSAETPIVVGDEDDGFSFSGIPLIHDEHSAANVGVEADVHEGLFVRCALDRGITTLAEARELLRSMRAGNEPEVFPLVTEQAQFYRKTVEEMAVALSLSAAGKTGIVFTLDDGLSYGLLKAADGKLTLFVPPTSLTSVNVFDMESMPTLPFVPTDLCNYATYAKTGAAAPSDETSKGKEELAPWAATDKSVAAAAAAATPVPVASAAAAAAPALTLSPVKKPVPSTAAATTTAAAATATTATKVAPAAAAAVAAKKASSALVPSDDDEDNDEEEDEPKPVAKKRELPAPVSATAEERSEERDKRAKTDPKKKTAVATAAPAKKATTEKK